MIEWNEKEGKFENISYDETEEEIIKIIESRNKKKVDLIIYQDNFDPADCTHCMNFDYKNEICKKNMPNINPWYTKDNDLLDECDEWDYIYETDEEKEG